MPPLHHSCLLKTYGYFEQANQSSLLKIPPCFEHSRPFCLLKIGGCFEQRYKKIYKKIYRRKKEGSASLRIFGFVSPSTSILPTLSISSALSRTLFSLVRAIIIVFFVFRMRGALTRPRRGGSIPWRACRAVSIIRGRAARSRL